MATIAIDFDGTCVTHRYPETGESVGAEPVLHRLTENGHRLILLTMRDTKDHGSGNLQEKALEWFKERNIPLWGVCENPEQSRWSESRKVYANTYIDDQYLGCPLLTDSEGRPYVDWIKVAKLLWDQGYLKRSDYVWCIKEIMKGRLEG